MNSGTNKMFALITIAFVGAFGIIFVRHQLTQMSRPNAAWGTSTLHIYSAKDGPWVVTHLVKLRQGTNEYAVAQLPVPATIIDSRGEYFTADFLQSLTWITRSGATSAPPEIGHPMKAFYFVPEESNDVSQPDAAPNDCNATLAGDSTRRKKSSLIN